LLEEIAAKAPGSRHFVGEVQVPALGERLPLNVVDDLAHHLAQDLIGERRLSRKRLDFTVRPYRGRAAGAKVQIRTLVLDEPAEVVVELRRHLKRSLFSAKRRA
jgi:hypothetical protein